MILVLEGGSGASLGLRWYKDFSINSSTTTTILLNPSTTGSSALWGAATSLYGAAKFTPIYGLQEYKTNLTGSAKHLKLNISIISNGFDASIQDLSIISLQGKIR
jgi:Gpi18-like mannosyltransferase